MPMMTDEKTGGWYPKHSPFGDAFLCHDDEHMRVNQRDKWAGPTGRRPSSCLFKLLHVVGEVLEPGFASVGWLIGYEGPLKVLKRGSHGLFQ